MSTFRSDSPIQYVKGVGPRKAEAFATLGIHTVGGLLEYFPFRHEIDRGEADIDELVPGTNVTIRGEVTRLGGRPPAMRCVIDDGTGSCTLRWFNQPFGRQRLFRGATVVASGHVQIYNDRPELVQPRIQVFEPDALLCEQRQGTRRVGVYRGNAHIKSPTISRVVQNVLTQGRLPVPEVIPPALVRKHKLPTREQAIRQMHSPADDAQFKQARTRLAYEEFLLMELALALRRRKRLALQTGRKLHVTREINDRIRARFPFTLTKSQDTVLREIVRDLQSGRPMTRLLQGDVGCGKTVVALYACLVAIANGKQAAIMAPTEILAQQHFANIDRYLADSRVRYVLLRGKLGKKQRDEIRTAIERGEIDLVVGTQALIQKDVAFDQLAMVVVDEQHKFGVMQRHKFRTKGPMPHYLVMTATPIPRTLAMTVFGDLDVSIIKHSPPGRGRIITKVVTPQKWETVMGYVRQRVEAGEQAYVVCPLIGKKEDETGDSSIPRIAYEQRRGSNAGGLISVKATHDKLVSGPWRGLDVGLLHGSLRPAEKQATIEAFAAGRLHAVVSTTVVEVGVDVSNATIMVVEHADRYGLSQLHQLRGRVGRGSKESLCVLIARDRGGKSAQRLSVMTQTTDGFKIAEADLRQRGPGQLFGTKQHGLPELQVADIIEDFGLLEQARQDAFAIAAADPELTRPENRALLPALKRVFGEKLALIDAA
ncbi:MAG: ATP-dependent DNA helicase RecG [Phycisphaerae bacterium]|nr:ATP-dependent DNA helicase RecG [Phycisphaerae bacterium]